MNAQRGSVRHMRVAGMGAVLMGLLFIAGGRAQETPQDDAVLEAMKQKRLLQMQFQAAAEAETPVLGL